LTSSIDAASIVTSGNAAQESVIVSNPIETHTINQHS
jgi:hypothetical protein